MRLVIFGLSLVVLISTLWCLYPSSITAVDWEPTELSQHLAVESGFPQNLRLLETNHVGPEDVAVGPDGSIYMGSEDGAIVKVTPSGNTSTFAQTGGRPLGLAFHPDGRLIVADAKRGLLSISTLGKIEILVTSETVPLINDCDVGADGRIYFSSSTTSHSIEDYEDEIVANQQLGSLLVYDPKSNTLRTLIPKLAFANGVAVAKDQSFVVVAETSRYQLHRYYLQGPKSGQHDVFFSGLPGFPDGVSTDNEGNFWVALTAPRLFILDALANWPVLREQIVKLPSFVRIKPEQIAMVIQLDPNGLPLRYLKDNESGKITMISSVEVTNETIYLGTLAGTKIGVLTREF